MGLIPINTQKVAAPAEDDFRARDTFTDGGYSPDVL